MKIKRFLILQNSVSFDNEREKYTYTIPVIADKREQRKRIFAMRMEEWRKCDRKIVEKLGFRRSFHSRRFFLEIRFS